MRELVNDPFYELIEKYKNCIIDYCLIEDDTPHQGKRSHKDAVLFAMLKVIERYIETQLMDEVLYSREVRDEPFPWNLDIGKAEGHLIDAAELLRVPVILRTDRIGQRFYDCGWPQPENGEQIPYWYAFWETPHTSGYGPDDFEESIPFCSRKAQMSLRCMSGRRTGRTILKTAGNGGARRAGAFTINA